MQNHYQNGWNFDYLQSKSRLQLQNVHVLKIKSQHFDPFPSSGNCVTKKMVENIFIS